ASVLGNRLSTRPLPVGNPASAWPNIPTGPRRTPRRVDGHGLGTVDQLAVLRRTQRRAPRPRHGPDPGSGGIGPQRLPSGISDPKNPTTLRCRALSSRKAQPRTETGMVAMPLLGSFYLA